MRVIVRGRSIKQVEKGMIELKKRGYKAVMEKPKLDEGNFYYYKEPSYVMVMETKNDKKVGRKVW